VYDSTHPTWAFLTASYYRGLVAMAQEKAAETIAMCRTAIAAIPQPVRRTPRPSWARRIEKSRVK
jgi:ABC-type arginine/histidine transport system permease subunit